MKKIIIAIFFMSLAMLPNMAEHVNIRVKSTLPHGGARMPSTTQVEADYEKGILTVNIQNYIGVVWVYIYDADGNVIEEIANNIIGNGTVAPEVNFLNKGDYTLSIVLSDAIYEGSFKVAVN